MLIQTMGDNAPTKQRREEEEGAIFLEQLIRNRRSRRRQGEWSSHNVKSVLLKPDDNQNVIQKYRKVGYGE
jgi:hypothetical protein